MVDHEKKHRSTSNQFFWVGQKVRISWLEVSIKNGKFIWCLLEIFKLGS